MALTEQGLTSIYLEKEQLDFFPFYVLFNSPAINQQGLNKSGFSLNWFLKDGISTQMTQTLPPMQDVWKPETPSPEYENPMLHDLINVSKELRLENITKQNFLNKVILQKSDTKL